MKSLLKKLGLTSVFCHYKYHLTAEQTIKETKLKKTRFPFLTGCFIDRNLFWATTRTYSNTNIIELKNIIQAEKKQLPPMEGRFFWSLISFTNDEFTVTYFVIPEPIVALIPDGCRVVLPFYTPFEEAAEQPLTLHHNQTSGYSECIEKLNWLNLIGLYIKSQKIESKVEKLSNKKLLVSLASIFAISAIAVSTYLLVAINYYQELKVQNDSGVNAVLGQRQEYSNQLELTSGFIDFLKANPNVLNKLSMVDIKSEGIFIERVKLLPKGVEIFGSSETSATTVLEQIMSSKSVQEAKFSRAVTKDRNGFELFTIEVTWK